MVTDGAVRRVAQGAIAASLVVGLAACGSAVAGAGGPGKPAAATPAASHVSPGGPGLSGTMPKHALLCAEIPRLTRMSFTRTAWPPYHARHEALPSGFIVRDPATVRQVATILCGLPVLPSGVMSCPDLVGGSYHLFFTVRGRMIPAVAIQASGCRVVTGLGSPRTWATSKALQQELGHGFGDPFRPLSPRV
jgi:hypothetical protein